jgi:hypothetical protein
MLRIRTACSIRTNGLKQSMHTQPDDSTPMQHSASLLDLCRTAVMQHPRVHRLVVRGVADTHWKAANA